MLPWNNWYHCIANTYGTWLPGDPRGFRTRHHRLHVDGDYKNPPPKEKYDRLHAHSKASIKQEPVRLSPKIRQRVCHEIIASLHRHDIEVIVLAVDAIHFHLLARFPDHNPRKFLGIAKNDGTRVLSDAGLISPGGIWGRKSECCPIKDRTHQLKVVEYILAHAAKGAAVWFFKNNPKG